MPTLETERLILRRWGEVDAEPFAALNADPEVCEFFPKILTRPESDALIARLEAHFETHGYGPWAVEVKGGARSTQEERSLVEAQIRGIKGEELPPLGAEHPGGKERSEERAQRLGALSPNKTAPSIGFVGLLVPSFEAHFTPCVEIGWRLARDQWGQGYASEAAREVLRFAFEDADLNELVSMTTVANLRSMAVMERLGFSRDPTDDFDHPKLDPAHPLLPHVLYRLSRDKWRSREPQPASRLDPSS